MIPTTANPNPVRRKLRTLATCAAMSCLGGWTAIGLAGCSGNNAPKTGLTRPGADTAQPIARAPGNRRSTDSRVVVSIRPLGSVPFDGMTLPLTSPDGRFIATQSGAMPSFAVALAEPGATVPPGLRITAAALPDPGSAPAFAASDQSALAPLGWSGSLPRGLLLGRSCNDRGFLVESPQPDGSRRIGMVEWRTGRLAWLVDQPGVIAAFASFGPSGELAFSRRTLSTPSFSLVVRSSPADASSERVLSPESDAESLVCPTFSADTTRVYAFRVATRAERGFGPLTMLSVAAPDGRGGLNVVSRSELGVEPTIAAAFQAVAPLQTPWMLDVDRVPEPLDRGVVIADLANQSMVWIDGGTGEQRPLARMTAGAAPLLQQAESGIDLRGMFLGTAKELVFQPWRSVGVDSSWGSDAGVISGAFIPRLAGWFRGGAGAGSLKRPIYILLSPPKGGAGGQVSVVLLTPADE